METKSLKQALKSKSLEQTETKSLEQTKIKLLEQTEIKSLEQTKIKSLEQSETKTLEQTQLVYNLQIGRYANLRALHNCFYLVYVQF